MKLGLLVAALGVAGLANAGESGVYVGYESGSVNLATNPNQALTGYKIGYRQYINKEVSTDIQVSALGSDGGNGAKFTSPSVSFGYDYQAAQDWTIRPYAGLGYTLFSNNQNYSADGSLIRYGIEVNYQKNIIVGVGQEVFKINNSQATATIVSLTYKF